MSAKLLQAREALRKAERDYHQMLVAEYPVGSEVKWERSGRIREGVIVQVIQWSGRVLARPHGAKRPYWIYASDIARAAEFAAATRKAAA